MSDLSVFITVNINADTPMDLNVGEHSALLTLGAAEHVTLEFLGVQGLERLRDLATTGVVTMHAQQPADPDGDAEESTAGGAR